MFYWIVKFYQYKMSSFNFNKNSLILLIISLIFIPIAARGNVKSVKKGGHVKFGGKDSKFSASWKVLGQNIQFAVIGETKGYIGFGFSPNGGMAGADIVIGGVYKNGTPYFLDTNSPGFYKPIKDKSQDYKLVSASENETHTKLKFTRKIKTCDPDDWQIDSATVRLIYALGKTDNIAYHDSNRGSVSANLLDPNTKSNNLSNYKSFDVINNMVLPSQKTMYWCTIHKGPPFATKQHLVAVDVILSNDAAVKHTHHMQLIKCTPPPGKTAKQTFGSYVGHPGRDCYEKNPKDSKFPRNHCTTYIHSWSIGSGVTMFPPYVGIPVQGNEYFMLEIHYDNPNEKTGLKIESGFKLFYTQKLRKYEGGTMRIGAVVGYTTLMVPPNSSNFTVVTHCNSNCTKYFPPGGINVYSIRLHSHLSGRKIRARVFRNGTQELPWPMDDQNYDFNFQQIRPLEKEFKILPGDHLTTECVYDTTWRNGEPVIGGRSTTEEMCSAWYYYYPLVKEVMRCSSEFPRETLWNFLGIENLTNISEYENDPLILAPKSMAGKSYLQIIKEFDWTAEQRKKYQEKVLLEPHDGYCKPVGETFVTGYPQGLEKYKYIPDDSCLSHDDS